MGCPEEAELLALIAGELDDAAADRIDGHLLSCRACSERLDELERADLATARAALAAVGSTVPGPPPSESAKGVEIEGYALVEEIARGGQGIVCLAREIDSGREVAIKLLLSGADSSVRQLRRFEREIEAAAGLRHPNIVEILDRGVADGKPYYVMPFVVGQAMTCFVSEHDLDRAARLELLLAVCEAVAYAHEAGVIHRDIKPGNILVDALGQPHVLDFGLAKAVSGDGGPRWTPLTAGGEFLGTMAYAAPEQSVGDPSLISAATDVFALGVLMYELLTGGLPLPDLSGEAMMFTERLPMPPGKRVEPLDEVHAQILHTALEERAEDRFPSAVEMTAAMRAAR